MFTLFSSCGKLERIYPGIDYNVFLVVCHRILYNTTNWFPFIKWMFIFRNMQRCNDQVYIQWTNFTLPSRFKHLSLVYYVQYFVCNQFSVAKIISRTCEWEIVWRKALFPGLPRSRLIKKVNNIEFWITAIAKVHFWNCMSFKKKGHDLQYKSIKTCVPVCKYHSLTDYNDVFLLFSTVFYITFHFLRGKTNEFHTKRNSNNQDFTTLKH